jgi:fido (protein-threonine AMPylation protein)
MRKDIENPDEKAQPAKANGLAPAPRSGDNAASQEHHDDIQTTSTTRSTPEPVAGEPRGSGAGAGGVSPAGAALHAEFDGAGERAGESQAFGATAESTRPLDATRELATAAGTLTYTEVSERIAVNIARCLDALLEKAPEEIRITPGWICSIHNSIVGELFPEWAGRFRSTDVQVGTHFPPPGHEVFLHVRNFCLDLEERLRHLQGAAFIAALLAWVDWRFQWVHPFKDFNGRTGRILLVALCYKLGLPPMNPAADESGKKVYFDALRAADAGDFGPLTELWLERLENAD